MAVTINASTSAGLVMTSDLSGVLTLQQNGVSLPNGGVAPAFFAYPNANQTITSNSFTKVQLQTESFDTNNNFDNVTNYRFTPTVAGYYLFSFAVSGFNSTTPTRCFGIIYKNGSGNTYGSDAPVISGVATSTGTCLTYMNGSTDYVELYGYITAVTAVVSSNGTPQYTFLSGCLVRGA